jgi:hypothetical protein
MADNQSKNQSTIDKTPQGENSFALQEYYVIAKGSKPIRPA